MLQLMVQTGETGATDDLASGQNVSPARLNREHVIVSDFPYGVHQGILMFMPPYDLCICIGGKGDL